MTLFWTIFLIAMIIVEAATAQFVSIWFAGGALGGLIASMFDLNIWLQIAVFIVVTALLLIFTKPFTDKLHKSTNEKTNADALIGKSAIVTDTISNIEAVGTVKIGGMTWSARSEDDSIIEKGKVVTIKKIDGVKLIVQ